MLYFFHMNMSFFYKGASGWRVILAGVLVLAAAVRFAALDSIPPGLWYDEALYCMSALSIGQDGQFPIFFMTEGHPHEPLFVYSLALWFKTFGVSVLSARSCMAVWGVLTVVAMWPLAWRVLRSRSWALAAVVVVAFMRWPLHFSRTVFRAGLAPLFITLTFVLFLRWRERKRPMDAALCGAMLGLGSYTYLSFRLVPVILLLWIARLFWCKMLSWKEDGRQLILMGCMAAAVFAPLGLDWLRHPDHFSGRTDEVSMFVDRAEDGTVSPKPFGRIVADIGKNALSVAGVWFVRGDHVGKHNLPLEPLFDPVTGLLFLLGVLWCCRNIARNEFAFLLLVWLAVLSATSVFSFGAPNILRMQGAIPATALVFVQGLRCLWRGIGSRVGSRNRILLVGLILFGFCALQLDSYFRRFPVHPSVRREFLADTFVAPADKAVEILRTGSAEKVWVPEELAGHTTFRLITWNHKTDIVSYPPDAELPTTSSKTLIMATQHSVQTASSGQKSQLLRMRRVSGWNLAVETPDGKEETIPWGMVLRP